ncbi:hypothetical protein EYF80_022148 [Liparis tanakae]|uniref:Uncharacterized protein n=1 Tax=Liparis tanakae TaxID=230148 RepID=A0A4Z2HRQ2_9TELE|nr:hypothetical protein EYF80_022148 [Liparis tanakae]
MERGDGASGVSGGRRGLILSQRHHAAVDYKQVPKQEPKVGEKPGSPELQVSSPLVPKQTIRRRSAVRAKSSPTSGGGFQSDMKDSWRERENRHKEPIKVSGPGASTPLNGSSEAS